jgi:HEPN domain-containing protein
MVRGIATKPARIGSDKIYLTKARDFLKGAIMEAEKENWNCAAVLSIHSVTSACDAICERSEIESKLKQARRIISLKNAAEYEDRLIKQTEAQEMLKDAQRLVEWVENKLGK